MLQGHINGTMLGKTIASRPSPCPLGGRVRAKAAPQVAPHFGTTLVNDLVFNGMHICDDIFILGRGEGKIWMYVPWMAMVDFCLSAGEGALNLPESLHLSSEWSNKLKWGMFLNSMYLV